jgi:Asp-tRNA(Asn)/Glu-tRNA(Gln) amidotransferase C subunit
MRRTLSSQLHFVEDIQKVDTEGVEPLRSLSDVTSEALKGQEVTIADLKEAFKGEELIQFKDRTRWKKKNDWTVTGADQYRPDEEVESWYPLGLASRTEGKYFVVDRREQSTETEDANRIHEHQ